MNNWMPLNDWTWHMNWMEALVVFIFIVVIVLTSIMVHLRLRNDKRADAWRSRETRWNAHLPSVLDRQESPEVLWELVHKDEQLYFVDYLYRQACRMPLRRMENPSYRQLMHLAEPYLKTVEKRVQNPKLDAELRARSVATLGKLSPYASLELIEKALEDPSDRVAFAALRALVDHEDPEACNLLSQAFSRFHGFNPEFVASLLARSTPSIATPSLMQLLLQKDAPLWGRVVAICTLEHWPPAAEYIPSLKTLAKDPQEPSTLRALILRVLSAWKAEPESRELIYEFASGDEEILRAHAMYAIGRLRLESENELLELGLYDTARWVAIEAATAWERIEGGEQREARPRWYLQSLDPALDPA